MAIETLQTRPSERTASKTARPGAIILARHGEPALSRKVKLSAEDYRAWWSRYEAGGLREGQTPPEPLLECARVADAIFCSTRLRSIETARAVAGERAPAQEALFIEAPLPPPRFPAFFRVSPRTWGVIARCWWWFFNHHAGEETRREAEARAAVAAERLIAAADNGDVLLLAHGFFNELIARALKARGWRLVRDGGFRYWAARRFEKRR